MGSCRGSTSGLQLDVANFFVKLYTKMFQVMNAAYELDDAYLACAAPVVSNVTMNPITSNVGPALARATSAARATAEALRTGAQVLAEVGQASFGDSCLNAISRMETCAICTATDLKESPAPCADFCVNVARGCVAGRAEGFQERWDDFADALLALSDRMSSQLNAESVFMPLAVTISDAIMSLQDSGFEVTQKVFARCGTPRVLSKRSADPREDEHEKREARVEDDRDNGRKMPLGKSMNDGKNGGSGNRLHRVLGEVKKAVRNSIGYWRRLPYDVCLRRQQGQQPHICWNGTSVGDYDKPIATDLSQNPEVQGPQQESTTILLAEQSVRLRRVSGFVRAAADGKDFEWWTEDGHEREGDLQEHSRESSPFRAAPVRRRYEMQYDEGEYYSGSGDYEDDEDYYAYSGSGDCDDEDNCTEQESEQSLEVTTATPEEKDIVLDENVKPREPPTAGSVRLAFSLLTLFMPAFARLVGTSLTRV